MDSYHFEHTDHRINGKSVYRIVNDRQRPLLANNKAILKIGTLGGYVEHPELIDPGADFWIAGNAAVLGETKISGRCTIRQATIYDSTIHGNVLIGDIRARKMEDNPVARLAPKRLIIRECSIRSDPDRTTREEAASKDYVEISGRTYIYDSQICGKASIRDLSRVISSDVCDSTVAGQCFITRSVILYRSLICGKAMVTDARIMASTVEMNARVNRSELWNKHITGDEFISCNEINDAFEG